MECFKRSWKGSRWMALAAVASVVGAAARPGRGSEAHAVPGQPFGVASVVVDLPPQTPGTSLPPFLQGPAGRVFYPAAASGRVRKFLGIDTPPRQWRVWFLFRGSEPFDVTIYTPKPVVVPITPMPPRRRREAGRLWTQWWRNYSAQARIHAAQGDYPPVIESYLVTTLARRLGLQTTLVDRVRQRDQSEVKQLLSLLAGTESLHLDMLRQTARGVLDTAVPSIALPPDPEWIPVPLPRRSERPDVEPMAHHVPAHCFYIRYGSFDNYLWQDKLAEEFGGDLSTMITLRGVQRSYSERIQKQLALKKSTLGDLFGNQVIADVALIGADLFVDQGAAVGMLFQARNRLLGNDLSRQQQEAYEANKETGATLETIHIAGHPVRFLSTADHRLRSFYASQGDFHLVTNSRWLMRQFLELPASGNSLAASPEFHHARTLYPLDRKETLFVFFPSAFFQRLLTPRYQIELRRRLRATTDLELVMLARLAARHEGHGQPGIRELVREGYLPQGFTQRPDGGGPIFVGDQVMDSLRGARGTFLPIPDVPLDTVTPSEVHTYQRQLAALQAQLTQLVPITLAIRRYEHPQRKDVEHLVIDGQMSPYDPDKFSFLLSMLGGPTDRAVVMPPDSVVAAQASLRGGILSQSIPPHIMFAGIQDTAPANDIRSANLFQWFGLLQATPGYLGAWPQAGFLDLLPLGLQPEPDPLGYSRYPLGLWRRQFGGFSVVSFQRPVLDWVTPQLRVVDGQPPAHLRARVADLSHTRLAGYFSRLSYDRALRASRGNTRLLHTLMQQLGVAPEDAKTTAERVLGVTLQCPLGGRYEVVTLPGGYTTWRSTGWEEVRPPADRPAASASATDERTPRQYQPAWMDWFRGANLHVLRQEDRLVLHAELDMKRVARPASLPLFDFFRKSKPAPKAKKPPQPR